MQFIHAITNHLSSGVFIEKIFDYWVFGQNAKTEKNICYRKMTLHMYEKMFITKIFIYISVRKKLYGINDSFLWKRLKVLFTCFFKFCSFINSVALLTD